jgi:DNA replication protein DnaC
MISQKKIDSEKAALISGCKSCDGRGCGACFGYCSFVDRMAEAEIPVDYWFRRMEDFYGDQAFGQVVAGYIRNLSNAYAEGLIHCFVGHRGTGKTMAACSILKEALLKGYGAYYTTIVDAVSKLLSPESYVFRDLVRQVDFFVLDEVDQRFFQSQGSQGLYGYQFETMIRTRTQNRLPTIMCTNSEDTSQIFDGEFQKSFESLSSQFVRILRAGGKDARKGKEKI